MHPGEVLREEFLKPLGLTAYRLAKAGGIPRTRIERIINEEVGVSVDTALRLARLFNTTPEFWLHLQNRFDVEIKAAEIGPELDRIHEIEHAA
jgi:addiction module HigA family antidote